MLAMYIPGATLHIFRFKFKCHVVTMLWLYGLGTEATWLGLGQDHDLA